MRTADRLTPAARAEAAVKAVLPASVRVDRSTPNAADLLINGIAVEVKWAGEGWLKQVRPLIARSHPNLIVAARRMSPGARDLLRNEHIGWVDESGAAEVAIGSLVVSRSGQPDLAEPTPTRWSPAVVGVAEAILSGTKPTVWECEQATGLSTGTCTSALKLLTDLDLLTADAARGRDAGRRITDFDQLLEAYARAAETTRPKTMLRVGGLLGDFEYELQAIGHRWTSAGVDWALTGAAASLFIAPVLTSVSTADVFLDARTLAELEASAAVADLRPIEGGRVTLRPFPTVATRRLARDGGRARLAPWPRIYVDLRSIGVRGEEAAEHLREIVHG